MTTVCQEFLMERYGLLRSGKTMGWIPRRTRHAMVILMVHALVAVTLLIVGSLLIIDGLPEHPPRLRHRKH